MHNAEREIEMINTRNKRKHNKQKGKLKLYIAIGLIAVISIIATKGNQPKIIGYTYDSGDTVWEMAQRCCPSEMDIRDVVREIEVLNGIENAKIYANVLYQVPIYENSARETDYLDMNTIVGYNISESGILLHTSDGNGYYIEK